MSGLRRPAGNTRRLRLPKTMSCGIPTDEVRPSRYINLMASRTTRSRT
jgi:hypothetical protein